MNTDEATCRKRRPNADFDGFTAPQVPDLEVRLDTLRVEDAVKKVLGALDARGQFGQSAG